MYKGLSHVFKFTTVSSMGFKQIKILCGKSNTLTIYISKKCLHFFVQNFE